MLDEMPPLTSLIMSRHALRTGVMLCHQILHHLIMPSRVPHQATHTMHTCSGLKSHGAWICASISTVNAPAANHDFPMDLHGIIVVRH